MAPNKFDHEMKQDIADMKVSLLLCKTIDDVQKANKENK